MPADKIQNDLLVVCPDFCCRYLVFRIIPKQIDQNQIAKKGSRQNTNKSFGILSVGILSYHQTHIYSSLNSLLTINQILTILPFYDRKILRDWKTFAPVSEASLAGIATQHRVLDSPSFQAPGVWNNKLYCIVLVSPEFIISNSDQTPFLVDISISRLWNVEGRPSTIHSSQLSHHNKCKMFA